jgi:hypothetical protein
VGVSAFTRTTRSVREGRGQARQGAARLVGHHQGDPAEVEWTPADDAEEDGAVQLVESPGDRARVNVTVEFDGDESRAAPHLDRDLRMLEAFTETR